jgi:hypothetical protein
MFDFYDMVRRGPKNGEIPLFCRGAIGLHAARDMIGLHPRPEGLPYQLLLGLTFMFTARGRNPADSHITETLKATEFRVKLPGSAAPYNSKMSGWIIYKVFHEGYILLRPDDLTLSGVDGDEVCFAILDKYPTDPGFPFWQFGSLFETDQENIPKQRWTLYRLGLNTPVYESTVPGWAEDIPSEAELLEMLKPNLWKGTYEIEIDLAPFKVDPDYKKDNHATMLVHLGLAIFDNGNLSYVGGKYVGDKTKPWPEELWIGTTLKMLSGAAEGKKYNVVDNHVTDNNPPPGMPPNERLLEVLYPGPTPASDGAKAGDHYEVKSYYAYHADTMLFEKIQFESGSHAPQTLHYTFEIE